MPSATKIKPVTSFKKALSAVKKLSVEEKQLLRLKLFSADALSEMKAFEAGLKKKKRLIKKTGEKIKQSIPELLKVSGYRNDFIAKKIGMRPSHFLIKKKWGNWTEKDIQKILSILTSQNNEVEKYLDRVLIGQSFSGEIMTSSEFEKQMKWE